MELDQYIHSLRDNLAAAATVGDEQTRMVATMLATAVEPAARLAIMNALSDLAAEVTLALRDQVVEVRLAGQDVRVVVTDTAPEDQETDRTEPPPTVNPEGDISRITVRLLEEIKAKAEQAASAQGVSLNAFVSQAVQGALAGRGRHRHRGGWPGDPWAGPWAAESSGNREQHRDDEQPGGAPGDRGSFRVRGWVQS